MKSGRQKEAAGEKAFGSGFTEEKSIHRAWFVLLGVMALYYAYRMFAFTPWYDELYTYYFFISKGPVYAAIHWPLPNNHVGYSVLSAFMDYLGNSYIGLRGISYLCALINMSLIYKISKTALRGWMPLCTVILYLSMGLVNQMAVQGRGYTLGITCCLLAFYCLLKICGEKRAGKRVYICYAFALILGLYAVSSNVYWVIPLCLSGGIYLLIGGLKEAGEKSGKEKCFFLKTASGKKLIGLVGASLCAALGTVVLYASIWVSIGSNLLVKEEGSLYYGMGHIKMILQAPFAAMGRGMQYMLDTPYIQSEERAGFAGRLWEWLKNLLAYYYSFLSLPVIVICIVGIMYLLYKIVKSIKEGTKAPILLYLFLVSGILLIPMMLLIQCKRPYYRVFTYGGLLLALLLGVLLQELLQIAADRLKGRQGEKLVSILPLVLVVSVGIKCFVFSGYNEQYGEREHEIAQAFLSADLDNYDNLCVTDCNQEYLLYFLYGIRCENREIEGADAVLLDKRMCDSNFDEMIWEFYHYYDSIPWEYINQNMTEAYENKDYVLYVRNS